MNADMLKRDGRPPHPHSLSLSLFFFRGGGERPFRPPLDPPLNYTTLSVIDSSIIFSVFSVIDNYKKELKKLSLENKIEDGPEIMYIILYYSDNLCTYKAI